MIGVDGGISVDLYIGESTYLPKGLGCASLSLYLQQVAFPYYSGETGAYIAHEQRNTAALYCSRAVGPPARVPGRWLRDVAARDGSKFAIAASPYGRARSK